MIIEIFFNVGLKQKIKDLCLQKEKGSTLIDISFKGDNPSEFTKKIFDMGNKIIKFNYLVLNGPF